VLTIHLGDYDSEVMYQAAAGGHIAILQFLVSNSGDINIRDR
jgi:hypothetical protein